MENGELLTKDYNALTLEQRVNAIDAARREGIEFARRDTEPFVCDCPAPYMPHRCPSSATFRVAQVKDDDYITAVVEPAWQSEFIEHYDAQDYEHDPRVKAFVKAAQDEYNSRLATLVYDEETGWSED